jgi:hypothetical protein
MTSDPLPALVTGVLGRFWTLDKDPSPSGKLLEDNARAGQLQVTAGIVRVKTQTTTHAGSIDDLNEAFSGVAVERRVSSQQRLPGPASAKAVDRRQRVRDQAAGATRRAAGTFAESLRHNDRRRRSGGDGGEQGVQAADPGVAVTRPLLGIAVDLDDRVVNINHHRPSAVSVEAPTSVGATLISPPRNRDATASS